MPFDKISKHLQHIFGEKQGFDRLQKTRDGQNFDRSIL